MSALTIAFSGKGGSGKTTLSSLVVRELIRIGRGPVLAVDADPNATLALTLGAQVPGTIADLRDRMGDAAQKVDEIPKERLMDLWLGEMLGEETGFDILTMGRPEGPKCYCYVNALLRRYLKELRKNYPVIVVDCEAGMEYLSRLTVDDVDTLVLVAEATPIGLKTAGRIAKLVDQLPVRVKQRVLALNKVGQSTVDQDTNEIMDVPQADATVQVPFDPEIYQRCATGKAIDNTAGGQSKSAIQQLTSLSLQQQVKIQNRQN